MDRPGVFFSRDGPGEGVTSLRPSLLTSPLAAGRISKGIPPQAAPALPLASYLQFVYTFSVAIIKVFRSGNSQAVSIPKKFRFRSRQVEITKRGDEIVLRERRGDLSAAFELPTSLSPDFFKGGRRQPRLHKRLAR